MTKETDGPSGSRRDFLAANAPITILGALPAGKAGNSTEDPGVHDWLDTGCYPHGQLMERGPTCSSRPLLTLKKVPFADVRKYLPADTSIVSAEERAKLLQARRIGAQLKRR